MLVFSFSILALVIQPREHIKHSRMLAADLPGEPSKEGSLTKVGRLRRDTEYPVAFKERLMSILAVRNLQEAGSLRAVSVAEI